MCFNQRGHISTLNGSSLKLVDGVSSTENDINTRLAKAWTAIDGLSIIWKSDLTDKIKCSFFQAAVESIRLYGCTTWTLTKCMQKKLDGIYRRMLRAILNKSWSQHPTKQLLYGYLPPIMKTIQVRRTRHAGYYWRNRDELISDVPQWTPSHEQAKAGRPARTYIQQLCADSGCSLEDLPEAMDDREGWRERVRDIRANSATWWWWKRHESTFPCKTIYPRCQTVLLNLIKTQNCNQQWHPHREKWKLKKNFFCLKCRVTRETIFLILFPKWDKLIDRCV